MDKTVEKRHTEEQLSGEITDVIDMIKIDETGADFWKKYQKKYLYAADISWDIVISSVYTLAEIRKNS